MLIVNSFDKNVACVLTRINCVVFRLYKATDGNVKISGRNIDDLDETWLRRYVIGFINQEPVLFATSIKENIRYGNPKASDEEVKNSIY